jgi:hypothetical protein
MMKNLLNCHTLNVHSFPISCENNLYKRIFYAEKDHNLWKDGEIAIHPHHTDIKITVLDGVLFNHIFRSPNEKEDSYNEINYYNKYLWNSHILNGSGGFDYVGQSMLLSQSCISYKRYESFHMKACELHTISVSKDQECVWLVEEEKPSCSYSSINIQLVI